MGGARAIRVLRPAGTAADATPSEAAALAAIGAGEEPRTIREAVHALQVAFGPGFRELRDDHLVPDLVRRGLLAARAERFLLVLPRTRHHRTPAGEAERDRVLGMAERARWLSPGLAGTRSEALAIVAGLGATDFVVEALRHALTELRHLLGLLTGDGDPEGVEGDLGGLLEEVAILADVLGGDAGGE